MYKNKGIRRSILFLLNYLSMKKILIITYYWPPSGGAGVQRWLKFCKYLPEHDWIPVIYTPDNPEVPAIDKSLLKDIPKGLEVLKLPIWEPMDFYRKFTGRKQTEKLGAGFLSEAEAPKFREKLAIWVRGNLFIPDAKRFWIKPSYKFLKKYLHQNNIDLIVSTGPPHTTHMIAHKLKKHVKLPWVADFRDPWTEIDFYNTLNLSRYADRKHKILEKKILDSADLIISIGKNMSDSFAAKTTTKQAVITNGYDEDDIPKNDVTVSSGKFILMHVGSINKDRNHSFFWNSVRQLINENPAFAEKFEFHLIGKVDHSVNDDIEKYKLKKWVNKSSYIPHSEVIKKLQQASVLYLPLNNTPNAAGILTGKVFEYFAAQKPILAIGPENGDLGNILKETGTGNTINFGDQTRLITMLREQFLKFERGELLISNQGIKSYTRKNLTKKLVDELEKLVNE